MREPWTREELKAALARTEEKIRDIGDQYPDAQPRARNEARVSCMSNVRTSTKELLLCGSEALSVESNRSRDEP